MRRILVPALFTIGMVFSTGCSDTKNSNPKPADPNKVNPRIKESGTGEGGTPKTPVQPQESGVKGD